jgi:hypothetical protein
MAKDELKVDRGSDMIEPGEMVQVPIVAQGEDAGPDKEYVGKAQAVAVAVLIRDGHSRADAIRAVAEATEKVRNQVITIDTSLQLLEHAEAALKR